MPTWIGADPDDAYRRRVGVAILSATAVLVVLALVAALLVTRRTAVESAAGIGDPYYPRAGGSGYDVTAYDVHLSFDPPTGRLNATTTVTLTPVDTLSVLHLDLALPVESVRLGATVLRHVQSDGDLAVTAAPLGPLPGAFEAGREIRLEVAYSGRPADVDLGGEGAVYTSGDETLIAGEPEGASAWYPVNEHPSDPARFAVTATVPSGYQAISVGRLVGFDAGPGVDVWRWATDEPTVSYATMLAVGLYDVVQEQVLVGGVETQAVYAVSRRVADGDRAMQWLRTSPTAADTLRPWLGAYPLTSIGGIVPGANPWWGGLETLGRPIYHPQVVGSDAVLHHELAHMWLGDSVTLQRWDDLFINESLATYAEWLAEQARGRGSPQSRFDDLYARAPDSFWRQRLSDPGAGRQLFTRVYDRGAMAVHATRVAMGDEAFFAFFGRWAAQRGPRSLEQWRAQAQEASSADLGPLFSAWLDGTSKVPRRPELGFR